MPTKAQDAARWGSDGQVWLDHVELRAEDRDWLGTATALTPWAVRVPAGFLASLRNLVFLDIRGGSAQDLDHLAACSGLRGLVVNQVRGLADVNAVGSLEALQILSLYGLPQVTTLPSLARLGDLRRVHVGSMKGLTGLTGIHDAPAMTELQLQRRVGVAPDDAERLAAHPTLERFDWFGEDVPDKVWVPFVEAVGKPKASPVRPEDWFAAHARLT